MIKFLLVLMFFAIAGCSSTYKPAVISLKRIVLNDSIGIVRIGSDVDLFKSRTGSNASAAAVRFVCPIGSASKGVADNDVVASIIENEKSIPMSIQGSLRLVPPIETDFYYYEAALFLNLSDSKRETFFEDKKFNNYLYKKQISGEFKNSGLVKCWAKSIFFPGNPEISESISIPSDRLEKAMQIN